MLEERKTDLGMFCLMVDYFLGRISAEKQLKLSCLNNLSRF